MSCNTQGAECCAAGESNNASKKQDSCCSSSRGCNSTSDLLPEDDGWNIYRRALPKNIVLDVSIGYISTTKTIRILSNFSPDLFYRKSAFISKSIK